jgi:hypothetical protein
VSRAFAVVLLAVSLAGSGSPASRTQPHTGILCHHCHRQCSVFVRRQWLHQIRRADAGD